MDNSSRTLSDHLSAVVISAPGVTELVQQELRRPGDGEVRIRLEGCGVCASNLTPWSGPEWMQFPTEPGGLGHEGWGHVDAIGPGVDLLKLGDRVAALSYHAYASHDFAKADMVVALPQELAGQPFLVLFKYFNIVIQETDSAQPDGGDKDKDNINIAQLSKQ